MIVVPRVAPPSRRWLAHLVRASEGAIRPGDLFDDDLPFDEDEILKLAVRERVAPLLHRGLGDGRIADPIPESFRRACERFYYATLHKNLIALDVGREVLQGLAAAGIEAAPVKGWAFLRKPDALHPDPGTRPMDDLDLMVRRRSLEEAEGVLADLAFRRITLRPAAVQGGHELAFHRSEGEVNIFVELHWAWAGAESLMRGFAVSGERFLDSFCDRTATGGNRASRLGHLLFASVHAARHTLERWIWLIDIHRLVSGSPLDWAEVVREARRWRVSGPLYAALAATRELLRTPVPREVLRALSPGPVRRRLLERSLAASMRDGTRPRAAWTAKLLLGETWWEVARTAAWAAAPGPAWHEGRGDPAGFPQRLTHPLRVLLPPTGGRG